MATFLFTSLRSLRSSSRSLNVVNTVKEGGVRKMSQSLKKDLFLNEMKQMASSYSATTTSSSNNDTVSKTVVSLKGFPWTPEEDEILKKAVGELGNKWKKMAATYLPGRSGQQCLNRWKKIDPVNGTHHRPQQSSRVGKKTVEVVSSLSNVVVSYGMIDGLLTLFM